MNKQDVPRGHIRRPSRRYRAISFVRAHPFRMVVVVAAVAVGVGVASVTTGFGFANGPGGVTLQTVSASRLAQDGLYLDEPTESSAITQTQADSAAVQAFPGTAVRETALVTIDDAEKPAFNGRTLWVVSLAGFQPPSAGPPPGAQFSVSFMLAFIDPATAEFVFATYGT